MKFRRYITHLLVAALLAACASSEHRAPVANRGDTARKNAAEALPNKGPHEKDWRPAVHVVQKGDTLFGIAFNYGFDYRDLIELNGIKNPNLISIGQEIRLPTSSPTTIVRPDVATKSEAASVTVESKPVESKQSESKPLEVLIKEQPKLVKYPYSIAAMAQIERVQDPAKAVVTPIPGAAEGTVAKVESKPAVVTAPVVESKAAVESKDTSDEGDDEALKWSMPTQGKLIAGFSESANRKGIDMAGQLGQPVVAAAPGKVVYSGSGLRGYGKLIIIKHNNTYLSAYAHNDKVLVKEGQSVTRGQKISEMGNTDADQVKLHFEVRRLGKPVDPGKYLPLGKS